MRVRDAEVLRAYVRLLGVSQRALAARAGIGHATLNHLLSGRRSTCSLRTARAIERALACPAGLFFDGAPRGEPAGRVPPRRPAHDPSRRPADGAIPRSRAGERG